MNDEKKCPCQTVIDLQIQTKEQKKRLNDGNVQFAIINTKLNVLTWIGAALATGCIGSLVALWFK